MKLNVGCGGTRKYPFRDYGCDVNLDAELPETGVKNFVRGDAENLPFRSNSFDEIYAGHLIEHLDSPERFVSECSRVLKKRGLVHVWTPNFLSANRFLDPTHKQAFNFFSIRELFRQSFSVRLPYNMNSIIPASIQSNSMMRIFFLLFCQELYAVAEKHAVPS